MKIKIAGKKWRKDFITDVIKRLGILADITKNNEAELFIICDEEEIKTEEILDFAKNGKSVIFLKPDRDVIKLFGNELMYTCNFPLIQIDIEGIQSEFLQVFPPVYLIRQKKGKSIGHFALDFSLSGENYTTKYPAIISGDVGSGKIVVFMYDLIATLLLLLQGWEFFTSKGGMSHKIRSNISRATHLSDRLINPQLSEIPQAYFHELLLLFLMREMSEPIDMLPRIWYLPFPYKSCFLLSGDSDGLEKEKLIKAWKMITEMETGYTQYTMINDIKDFSADELKDWKKSGIDFGLHYYAGPSPSFEEMLNHLIEAKKFLLSKKIQVKSCRGHSLIWVGWDEQVEIMSKAGFLYSSNLLYWCTGVSYGFPYHLYTENGKSKVQELQIFTSDDVSLFNKSGNLPVKPEVYLKKMIAWLDINKNLYHQPLNPIFHPVYLINRPSTASVLKESILYAKANNIPVMNHEEFFSWWEKRKNMKITYSIKNSSVEFSIPTLDGMGIVLPVKWNGMTLLEKGEILGTGEMLFSLKDKIKFSYKKDTSNEKWIF